MLKALKIIKHNGELFLAGDIIQTISENDSKRLIRLGAAEKVNAVVSEETAEKTASIDSETEIGIDETVNEVLELNFNTSELKDGAKEQGLSFKANISKKALIELIVSNDAEGYFLDQLED